MKVLIVEDEVLAVKRLISLLTQSNYNIEIVGICDSVRSTLEWLENQSKPDIVFLDIQLSDGHSFEIFKKTKLDCPIIFTTAFDEYAIQAFQVSSIGYLLKPFQLTDIERALAKYHNFEKRFEKPNNLLPQLETLSRHLQKKHKSRFFVKARNKAYSILTADISIFNYEDKAVLLYNNTGKKFLIRYSLDELEELLDPNLFFRISRKHILNINYIKQINTSIKGKLSILINCSNFKEELIISKHRMSEFRNWLDR